MHGEDCPDVDTSPYYQPAVRQSQQHTGALCIDALMPTQHEYLPLLQRSALVLTANRYTLSFPMPCSPLSSSSHKRVHAQLRYHCLQLTRSSIASGSPPVPSSSSAMSSSTSASSSKTLSTTSASSAHQHHISTQISAKLIKRTCPHMQRLLLTWG